jgi:hypothetical protein
MAEQPPQIVVRNVDPALWRRVRAEAVQRGTNAGTLLNEIIREWLERKAVMP